MIVWRICKRQFAESAFSGEGARLFSGRWNPQDVRMVYTSPSLALAAMEFLVHLDASTAPDDLVAVSAEIPETLKIAELPIADLPADWEDVNCLLLQALGKQWISGKETAALRVPSAAVRGEWNVLLNPEHADFAQIVAGEAEPWSFDPRVLRKLHM